MLLFKSVSNLQTYLLAQKKQGKTIGFAPTMGALHQGHLSLVDLANSECDISVTSIFVNPTQFNDPKDLEKYPRTEAKDIALLLQAQCQVLFMPNVSEIYPKDLTPKHKLDFGDLALVMEGAFRPGHFDGMAQVVGRLLDIVQPHKLYMGQKDFQQFSIVQNMLKQLRSDIQIVMCPIIRESDGLAMSSRNVRLPAALRQKAPLIHQTLQWVREQKGSLPPSEIAKQGLKKLDLPDFKPEYLEIVDGYTLQPIQRFEDHDFVVACVATWLGEIRLIDNIVMA
jgi:pantoate--beta-alanine ligase